MSGQLPPLISALLEPGCYAESVSRVDLMETHASWVLLAGDYVYKIKKPITLPFLDYGTLEQRRLCCEAELRLNRRFAPELYLDLIAIVGTNANPQLVQVGAPRNGHTGSVIEYAVKMRRFDEADRLDHVCARGELTPAHIVKLAHAIFAFHRIAEVAPESARFGAPPEVLAPVLENFDELRTLLPHAKNDSLLNALEQWSRCEFARLTPRFIARRNAGCVRECHGDLHLGNLVLIENRVTLFDCIEFSENFRWIDVASEIAFTYVDLLDHGQPGLAGLFLNEWLSSTGDYDAVSVLRFYAVYRALVRAKVSALMAVQAGNDFFDTLAYLALAKKLVASPRSSLTITHGVAGCGKTTAAQESLLLDPAGATLRLRSDVERKRLFDLSENSKSGSSIDGGIYSAEANRLTYQRLSDLASQLLASGWSVIVDAAFLKRAERTEFQNLANQAGVDFFILAPQTDPDKLKDRILTRLATAQDASEATVEVLNKQLATIEPLDASEQAYLRRR